MKHKLRLTFLISFLFFTVQTAFAQEKEINGTVTSKIDGIPLPGVNVLVEGTTNGTQTDFDGNYSLTASVGDVLVFSYIGMTSVNITIGSSSTINVQLEEDAEQLGEVIVTALGIKKTRKSLTYSAQDIKADELNRVKQSNPINSLSGKVAGVTVNRSSSGVGGSVKITLRGNSSTRNNQPLYVVDGIPMSNPTSG
ncbi:MAG: carboxypeptidase-like regulatory domain-containing protein, partial [Bacteroidetes bacterium]|nr:carboxypeptidase-like regulatory domain-containing protein [Bacteroidota bacterium]